MAYQYRLVRGGADIPAGRPSRRPAGNGGLVSSRPPDQVSLLVGQHSEGDSGHRLRRLDDAPAQPLGLRQRVRDVLDADEEQHRILIAL
jgi:hypothetical protein